ncbi:MAG TPA: efflux transporter outer membrane subunit [Casimicrobiaceae bacterium]|nr:efflux transporter outer membrane subunit [Casimicrobiaceae bacterium]
MRAFALACLGCAALAGCMMGPDYARPKVDSPATFRFEPKEVAETADLEWWKQFGDPVLDQLIAEALANNMSVKQAAANVEQALGIITQTRSALYPQVGYSGSATRARSPDTGLVEAIPNFPNPQTTYEALLTATWEIDLWGRIRRLSEAAQANMFASDEARRGVILTLVSNVAVNYITLRGLDEQLVISERTLGTYGESVRLYKLQFQYGQTSQMTVSQAQSQYETAAAQIPQIQTQIAQTENALSVLIGRNPAPIPRGKSIYDLALPALPAGVPSMLLTRRPDLMQAEQQLVAANAQIGAARALYFPTISLTGAFGSASTQLSDLFKGPARVWNYAGSFVGPIFTFGAVSGQVAQAEAGQKAALYNYQFSIQNAFADVDNALVANQNVKTQLGAQERLVAALSDYARLAKLQYDGGYTSYTTVLQAEQSLFPAELQLALVRASVFTSAANVYKAMGGGWVTEADKLTGGTGTPSAEEIAKQPLF